MKRSLLPAVLSLFLAAGCEDSEKKSGVSWNGSGAPAAPAAQTADGASSGNAGAATAAEGDQVAFSALSWSFGGVNGHSAAPSDVTISGLRMGRDSLSFSYSKNLSAWGLSNGDAGALACLFVQRSDGSWVGGKFDWISSSRTSRSLENVFHGYGGWSLAGVPNPCPAAFVIVDGNAKRRSNVIAGTWSR